MLKLMKYEFRKWRTTLLALLGGLVALEVGFIVGLKLDRPTLMTVCLSLIGLLTFAAFAYLTIAGIAGYSQELREKSGYLVFMAPVQPISIVLSKLLFIALVSLASTALFGAAGYLDFRALLGKLNLDAQTMDSMNALLRFGLKTDATVQQILQMASFVAVSVMLEVLLTMCTAYLAITLSATLLQNKKGFLKGLISIVLFVALSWGSSWLAQKLLYTRIEFGAEIDEFKRTLGLSLLLNFGLCALFAGVSAWLLDKKVDM